ncbi:hypothetical protein [Pseudoclavibacter sp. VKM Ac-2867]|uniref:hypothetical protein n=1 Tax=Pseudoclavibacter sp. VKM Ac-2867 TaxID=2783829 RepID=UPI00188D6DAE|nr:hypothetical protein [Pseudoclavibacter sp. VKM Ac-2867]MBF4459401.1 hypothetical protein [Pseudoclavibacter sp. VKM Ac-2867]
MDDYTQGAARERIFETITLILERGLTFARNFVFNTSETLDAEAFEPSRLPSDQQNRLLRSFNRHWNITGFTEDELDRHPGLEPIEADIETHAVIVAIVRSMMPHAVVGGEEASDADWAVVDAAPLGTIIYSVDAIDGSLPYDSMTFGFSVNVSVHVRRESGDELLAVGIANSSGYIAIWDTVGVHAGTVGDVLQIIAEPLVADDIRAETVAAVAAQGKDRSLADELLNDLDLILSTLGGAPVSLGLVVGRLGAIVSFKPQAIHDAVYLPILTSLGITIVTSDGRLIDSGSVGAYFTKVGRDENGVILRPVPAFVAARNPITAHRLREKLFGPLPESDR